MKAVFDSAKLVYTLNLRVNEGNFKVMSPQGQLPSPSLSSSFLKVIWADFELRLSSKPEARHARTNNLDTQIHWRYVLHFFLNCLATFFETLSKHLKKHFQ